ncbi:MAG: CoA transferase [Acidimicrobiales bacterium]
MDRPTGPLQGVRIIDLSAVVSGPFGTSILADQGADVIMVEQAHQPDLIRASGPLAGSAQGVSAPFNSINRNKRSITLNLKHDDGKALLKRLVAEADVVVQNFRPGALDRLGVGWDELRRVNPELIMCSISGFGSDGRTRTDRPSTRWCSASAGTPWCREPVAVQRSWAPSCATR